jgi:hypothetical protein
MLRLPGDCDQTSWAHVEERWSGFALWGQVYIALMFLAVCHGRLSIVSDTGDSVTTCQGNELPVPRLRVGFSNKLV